MTQPDQGQDPPQSATLRGRIHAQHIDLAKVPVVDLRPVETHQRATDIVEREEKAGGVEPPLSEVLAEVGKGPAALLGMPGKSCVVDPQQFGVILGSGVGPDSDT